MKGNDKIISCLNQRLSEELTAINQYMVHSEMCDNWGYERLHGAVEKRAVDEMKHAEKLIARILFLEGQPAVGILNKISIGSAVRPKGRPCRPTTKVSSWQRSWGTTARANCWSRSSGMKRRISTGSKPRPIRSAR
jgi:hypothetical protein